LLERQADDLRLIIAHLGAGASVTAIRGGRSVDTSMGFTPLEGLIMAMRSGSVDPGALLWLQLSHGVEPSRMSDALEHTSGLFALAGTGDMREVLTRAATGDAEALVARDAYVRRVCSHIGAMATSLDRIDALVFTGGVGEHAAEIRTAVCAELRVLGVMVPTSAPSPQRDALISDVSAQVAVLVVFAREDLQIALEVRQVIHRP
jgi:acetate kinase